MKNFRLVICNIALFISFQLAAQNSYKVQVSGEGDPILLFPGFSSSAHVYNEIITLLSKDHEVHAFTFAGFGDVPPIKAPWLATIKAEIENYVFKNTLKNPIILGHSMGGTLGLWLASELDIYKKLIIIDALPAMGALMFADYNSASIQYDSPYNQQLLKMNEAEFEAMTKQMAATMSLNPKGQQKIASDMVNCDRKTYVYGYTDLLKLDLREKLSNIDIPVIILAANLPYGKDTVEMNYKNQYQNLKNYTLTFTEKSKHFIMYDQPDWLNTQIKMALKTNE